MLSEALTLTKANCIGGGHSQSTDIAQARCNLFDSPDYLKIPGEDGKKTY